MMTTRPVALLGSLLLAGTVAACGGGGTSSPSPAASVAASKPAASLAASKPAASVAASAKPAGSAGASAKPAASGSAGAAAKPAPSIAPATKAATVKITANATLGNILTDGDGKTLYAYDDPTTPAGKDPTKCSGACLGPWPPFLSTTAPAAPSGVTGTFTLVARTDIGPGVQQVAYNGAPLYYFVQDQAPGDAKGQGSKGFGGNWMVIKIGGGSGASAAASKPAAG
jgi:predicted lipoprotein with Yx(FWY)xxD motif